MGKTEDLRIRLSVEGSNEVASAFAKSENAVRRLGDAGSGLRGLSGPTASLAKDLGRIAIQGDASGAQLANVAHRAAQVATQTAAIGPAAARAVLGLTGIGAIAGTVFTVVVGRVNAALAALDKLKAKNAEWEQGQRGSAAALGKRGEEADFKASIAGADAYSRAMAEAGREAKKLGAENKALGGNVEQLKQKLQGEVFAEFWAAAVRSSKQANAELTATIRAAAQGGLAALDKLRAGLAADLPTAQLERLKKLKDEIDFKGPVGSLKELDEALRENEQRIRDIGKESGLTNLQAEIDRTSKLLKQRFSEDELKAQAKLDAKPAEEELSKLKKKIDDTKGTVKVDADTGPVLNALEEVRARMTEEFEKALQGKTTGGVDAFTAGVDVVGGDVADPRSVLSQLQLTRFEVQRARSEGDAATLAATLASLQDFQRTFGGGLLQQLRGDFGLGGLAGSGAVGAGALAGATQGIFVELAALMREIKTGLDEVAAGTTQTARNTAETADATRDVGSAIKSPGFISNVSSGVRNLARQQTGDRNFEFGR